MAARIWNLQVTVPAGTLQANPQVTSWRAEDNIWNTIELVVPPGHNGLTGIRIMKGDVSVVPYNSAQFITANNYAREFLVDDYMATADVKIHAFNVGQYPHTFYLRATITDLGGTGTPGGGSPSQAILVGGISASPDPLSPDAILGPSLTDQLANGVVTADQVASGVLAPATG